MGGFARVLLAFTLLVPAGSATGAEGRAFWLTRWDARDAGAVVSALEGMAALRANTLFLQVYADGLALHRSALVPRSHLVAEGFDPLALAVTEGRGGGPPPPPTMS